MMGFRQARRDEFDPVMAILDDGREAIKELGIDQWQLGYPQRDIIEGDIQLGQCYVLEDDGDLLGTAALVFTGEHTYDAIEQGAWLTSSHSSHPTYCTIHRVAVAKGSTRRGAGRRMLEEAERVARQAGSKSVRIDTHPGNTRMRGLLAALGYTECGVIYIDHAGENTPDRIAYEKIL